MQSRFGQASTRPSDSLDRSGMAFITTPPPHRPSAPDVESLGRRGGESPASNTRVGGGGDVNAGLNASIDNLVEGVRTFDLKCPLPQYPSNQLQLTSPELEMTLQSRHGPYFTLDVDLAFFCVNRKGLGDDVIRIFEFLQIHGAILHILDRDSFKHELGIRQRSYPSKSVTINRVPATNSKLCRGWWSFPLHEIKPEPDSHY
ncbi:hypothetical protein HDU76_006444 [Blyttiomyces sp. JEL0837]|nr:hypothetical protein HDU76_006444 [Blyttiomyces sp. JEL0837]